MDVRFQLNRVVFRRQHQALCEKHYVAHLLFPSPTHVALPLGIPSELNITLYDPKIANNLRQFRAIKHILSLPSAATSGPFIIFGP